MQWRRFIARVSMLLAALFPLHPSISALEKLKPEELVANHLESIGSAQNRAAITSRIIAGTSLVIFRSPPPGQAAGRAVLASDGIKNLFGMSFQSPVYPREELGFNGNTFIAAYVTPGVRSALGNFLMTHDVIFKQGLMGGALSSAWPFLDVSAKGARLDYAGTRKVDSQVLHELKYMPRGGSDLQITLFFDLITFRHVKTVYERVISASMGTRDYVNVQERETRYKMVEEFSQFGPEQGLTLPHNYKIKLSIDSKGGTFLADWMINLTQFSFNQKIDPAAFSISAG